MEENYNEFQKFTKFEMARIIGARAAQIEQGAPFFVKLSKKDLEAIEFRPIEIAKIEMEKDVLPITVIRR